jgi:hypothetical protein
VDRSRAGSDQAVVEPAELLLAVVLDDDPPTPPRPRQANLRPECPAQVLFDPIQIGISCRISLCRGDNARLAQPPDELLGLANGQVTFAHQSQHARLAVSWKSTDRPSMAFGDAAGPDRRLDVRIEIEQAERVRDRRACPTDA